VRRGVAVLLLLALAECSPGGGPDSAARQQCERQAYKDPKVAAIYSSTDGNYTYVGTTARDDLLVATREAVMRCMREKGLLPPGGVQPVRPRL
jgi:hypothetical protein